MASSNQARNVFNQPLKLFSQTPMTGFFRDGYCRTTHQIPHSTSPSAPSSTNPPLHTINDPANHALAGIVTDEFLDYSASRGNDLRNVGLKGGCKWCLCTSRWLQAVEAWRSGRVSEWAVPRVDLEATEDSVLRSVDMATLRRFEAAREGS